MAIPTHPRARAAWLGLLIILTIGAYSCASEPLKTVRTAYVAIPDHKKRSDPVDISNGLGPDGLMPIAQWISDHFAQPGADGPPVNKIMKWLEPLSKGLEQRVTYADLKFGGRINRLFDGNTAGRPYEGQDARFEFYLKPHEVLVFVNKESDKLTDKFAYAFYRAPAMLKSNGHEIYAPASRPSSAQDDVGNSNASSVIYTELLIFDRTIVDTVE